ncbi:hypothetical protein Droror1_Dr00002560 [Drosera rotundifolia]
MPPLLGRSIKMKWRLQIKPRHLEKSPRPFPFCFEIASSSFLLLLLFLSASASRLRHPHRRCCSCSPLVSKTMQEDDEQWLGFPFGVRFIHLWVGFDYGFLHFWVGFSIWGSISPFLGGFDLPLSRCPVDLCFYNTNSLSPSLSYSKARFVSELFVKKLSFYTTENDSKNMFSPFGVVRDGRQAGDTYPKQRGDSSRVHGAFLKIDHASDIAAIC